MEKYRLTEELKLEPYTDLSELVKSKMDDAYQKLFNSLKAYPDNMIYYIPDYCINILINRTYQGVGMRLEFKYRGIPVLPGYENAIILSHAKASQLLEAEKDNYLVRIKLN